MQTHRFTFNYDGEKDFELRAKSKTDRDEWVEAIEFLIEIREKLGNMVDERSVSVSTYFSVDTPIVEKSDEGSSKSKGSSKSYKYANLGKDEVMGIMDDENDQFHNIDKQLSNQKKQSEQILIETGIWDYISQIPDNKRNCRVQYGFLGKPTRNALKIEKSRWLFLISSRPLTQDAYLQDNDEITEDDLPILIKFDTIYYYSVGFNNKDAELKGEIKTIDIDSVHINNENNGIHSFVIDAKSKKYEFVSKKRFYIEQWIDAIELSAKTAKEKQYSITGKIRNISMIITSYEMDRDELRERVERDTELMLWDEVTNNYKEFDEIHNLLLLLSEIKEEMIYIFDACMVQKPPRKDIIELYMETTHIKLCERLTYEWNEKALLMGPLDIFALLEWIFEYMTTLNKFGIKDDSIDNGYLILCGAYKRKIHMQIYPMITNVLIREREAEVEESESGVLYTHSPADIFKIFNEVFEILTKKPMKEMILGVLEILHQVFTQYQRALYQMINMDQTLSVDYLIALNNNFSRYFDFIELLLSPLKRNENITETEIEKSFDQREIQQLFSKITSKIVERIGEETWILAAPLYQINYIDLDIEQILYKSMQIFDEKIKLMNKQTSREVWKVYLKKTVIAYVQLMLNSTMSIKKSKGTSLIQGKIQKDYEQISDMFSECMTKRLLKAGLEVLTDLTNFFEASVDFLPISVGKMRKEHGPSFNLTTIKALLSLRTDLDKQEKTAILKECKEILNEYKNEKSISHSGIFNCVNTAEAVKEFNDEMKDPEEEKTKGKGKKEVKAEEVEEEEDEFNLDDFLKEGGINVEDLEEKPTEETEAEKLKKKNKDTDGQVVKKIVGREDMSGWLFKSNDDVKQDKALFDHVLNTVSDTFHSVVDNINKTRTKRYFRIKKDHLYWYTKMDSNKAQNEIDIRKIEQLEINQENEKMILILYKNKLYKLEGDSKDYVEEWYKSIALVRSKTDEYLNLDRYVDSNVFRKVTGNSIFRNFEEILEEHFKVIDDQKRKEQEEINRKKREEELEIQRKLELEMLEKQKSKRYLE